VCLSAAARAPVPGVSDSAARVTRILTSGAAAATVALAGFAAAHIVLIVLIVPIWTRLLGGLPMAQSARGAWLSLAIAPICLIPGAVIASVRRRFQR
jgi:hypothetical protein